MFLWELLITSKDIVLFVASQNRTEVQVITSLAFAIVSLNFKVVLQMLLSCKIYEAGICLVLVKDSKRDKTEGTSKL